MKKYITLIICTFQESIAYRITYFIHVISLFIYYLVIFFVWHAIYTDQGGNNLMQWHELRTYLVVSLAVNSLIARFSELRLARQIRSGNIAFEILRPINFQKANLSISIGSNILEALVVIIVIVITGCLLKWSFFSITPLTWGIFLLSIVLAYLLKFSIIFICGMLCFWTTSSTGITWARIAVTDFFSGTLIPLTLFPGWLDHITRLMPFRGIVHVPALILINNQIDVSVFRELIFQSAWLIALWFGGSIILHLARKKLSIYGG